MRTRFAGSGLRKEAIDRKRFSEAFEGHFRSISSNLVFLHPFNVEPWSYVGRQTIAGHDCFSRDEKSSDGPSFNIKHSRRGPMAGWSLHAPGREFLPGRLDKGARGLLQDRG